MNSNRVNADGHDDESSVKHKSKCVSGSKKTHNHCPVCKTKLKRIAKGTRHENQCSNCNATLAKELKCKQCNSHRVWRGPQGIFCQGCGSKVDLWTQKYVRIKRLLLQFGVNFSIFICVSGYGTMQTVLVPNLEMVYPLVITAKHVKDINDDNNIIY